MKPQKEGEQTPMGVGYGDLSEPNQRLMTAAFAGDPGGLEEARKAGADNFEQALCIAAAGGRCGEMKTLKEWGATNFDYALITAAKCYQCDAIMLAKEWGATRFVQAFCNISTSDGMKQAATQILLSAYCPELHKELLEAIRAIPEDVREKLLAESQELPNDNTSSETE